MTTYHLRSIAQEIVSDLVYKQPVDLSGAWTPSEQQLVKHDVNWEKFQKFLIDIRFFDEEGNPVEFFYKMGFFVESRFRHGNKELPDGWIKHTLASNRGRLLLDILFYRLYEPYILNPNS